MAEIDTEVKRWGNSLGVRLPRDALRAAGIDEGDRVWITVRKQVAPNPEFYGMAKRFKVRNPITYAQFKAEEHRRERAHDRRLGLR